MLLILTISNRQNCPPLSKNHWTLNPTIGITQWFCTRISKSLDNGSEDRKHQVANCMCNCKWFPMVGQLRSLFTDHRRPVLTFFKGRKILTFKQWSSECCSNNVLKFTYKPRPNSDNFFSKTVLPHSPANKCSSCLFNFNWIVLVCLLLLCQDCSFCCYDWLFLSDFLFHRFVVFVFLLFFSLSFC